MGTLLRSELRKDIGIALQKKRGQMITIDPNLFHGCDGIGLAFATYGDRRASSCIAGRTDPRSEWKISSIDCGYRPHVPAVSITTGAARADRIELRVTTYEKRLLATAAAYERADMASFIMENVLPTARQIVDHAERIVLSERDTMRVLVLLENPPKPTPALIAATRRRAVRDMTLMDSREKPIGGKSKIAQGVAQGEAKWMQA